MHFSNLGVSKLYRHAEKIAIAVMASLQFTKITKDFTVTQGTIQLVFLPTKFSIALTDSKKSISTT